MDEVEDGLLKLIKTLQIKYQNWFVQSVQQRYQDCEALNNLNRKSSGQLFEQVAGISAGAWVRLSLPWIVTGIAVLAWTSLATVHHANLNSVHGLVWWGIPLYAALVVLLLLWAWLFTRNRLYSAVRALLAVVESIDGVDANRFQNPSYRGEINFRIERCARSIERLPSQLRPGDPVTRALLYDRSRRCAAGARQLKSAISMPEEGSISGVLTALLQNLEYLASGEWWLLPTGELSANPPQRTRHVFSAIVAALIATAAVLVPVLTQSKLASLLSPLLAVIALTVFGNPQGKAITSLTQAVSSVESLESEK